MPLLYRIQPSYDTLIYLGNTVTEIDRIKEMLNKLSESALAEVGDFIAFLLEKEGDFEGGGHFPHFLNI